MVTVVPGQHFSGRVLGILQGAEQRVPIIRGTLVDQQGRALSGFTIVAEGEGWLARALSDQNGAFFLETPGAGLYVVSIEGDDESSLSLELEAGQEAVVEWVETWDESRLPLPLAEVRTVAILHRGRLAFDAHSPWPGARCQWRISGGELIEERAQVVWQPPAEPGRYLLEVVADWGRLGLAVDAVVLVVREDGRVSVGV